LSTSLSATVAVPSIPKFYKSNVQGSNKSISVIPDFLNGLFLGRTETSGNSEVAYNLLGVRREESKSVLLENIFSYGVDSNLWTVKNTGPGDRLPCLVNFPYRNAPREGPAAWGPLPWEGYAQGWVLLNKRLKDCRILSTIVTTDVGTQQLQSGGIDAVFNPTALIPYKNTAGVITPTPASVLTGFDSPFVSPVIYWNKNSSCVTMEGWMEPTITTWWLDYLNFQGQSTGADYGCSNAVNTSPYEATMSLETKKAFRYEPGKAITFTMGLRVNLSKGIGSFEGNIVNSKASWGARNDTDTYRFVLEGNGDFYVERATPYVETSEKKYRRDFLDPLDGTGPSGLTIDFNKVTMYSIEFSWYGAVGASFFIYVPFGHGESRWVKVATLLASNRFTKPALSNPSLKLFTELYVPMGCGALQTLSLYGSSVYIDGNFRDTLKIFNIASSNKKLENTSKNYLSFEVPNFLQGNIIKPKNTANVFPLVLNGISTVDAVINLLETSSGGGVNINTAYYETSTNDLVREFTLRNNVFNNRNDPVGKTLLVETNNMSQAEKLDFMTRAVGMPLTMTIPVTTYERFTNAGTNRLSGQWINFSTKMMVLSSAINSNIINISLSDPFYNPFLGYVVSDINFINQRRAIIAANTHPVVNTYPSIPYYSDSLISESVLFPLSGAINNKPIFRTNVKLKNNSYIISKKALKSGSISIDTDAIDNTDEFFGFGFITENEYLKLINKNIIETKNNTQIISTNPAREFFENSEIIYTSTLANGTVPVNYNKENPAQSGFPQTSPFWRGWWDQTQLPTGTVGSFPIKREIFFRNPLKPINENKSLAEFRFTTTTEQNFTFNVELRHHTFYLYGSNPRLVSGPDMNNFDYVEVEIRNKDIFSLEDGVLTNNLYNIKLLIYGHNGQFMTFFKNKKGISHLNNWTDSNAAIETFGLGLGTSYSISDSDLELNATLVYTVRFPKNSLAKDNFIKQPNILLDFKSIFMRNVAFSFADPVFVKNNLTLWYGTFIIAANDPLHFFILFGSNRFGGAASSSKAEAKFQIRGPINAPIVSNIQFSNTLDKFDIKLAETQQFYESNVTLVTTITSTVAGIVKNLPMINFNFKTLPSVNILYDNETSQPFISNGITRLSIPVVKNIPFSIDLTSIYAPSKTVITPETSSVLAKDFKRLFVTGYTLKTQSFSDWGIGGAILTPNIFSNPFGTNTDSSRFVSTDRSSLFPAIRNITIQKTRTPRFANQYYINSVFIKPITPNDPAGRFFGLQFQTGRTNSENRQHTVMFDLVRKRIGFTGNGTVPLTGEGGPETPSNNIWVNSYDNTAKDTVIQNISGDQGVNDDFRWFPLSAGPGSIKGFANLGNKTNGRYIVAAHVQEFPDNWFRVSACTYYYRSNTTLNTIRAGTIYTTSSQLRNPGTFSLWGFVEESRSISEIETLSSFFPSFYIPPALGTINVNMTLGEQR